MKKIFVFCLFLVVAVASIGLVSAASEEIGGYTFNIPDGFSASDSSDSQMELGTLYNKIFKNSKGDIINITVVTCDNGNTFFDITPTDPGYENKTLAAIDGFYWANSPSAHMPVFTFLEEGNQRLVSIAATNANDIEACLK